MGANHGQTMGQLEAEVSHFRVVCVTGLSSAGHVARHPPPSNSPAEITGSQGAVSGRGSREHDAGGPCKQISKRREYDSLKFLKRGGSGGYKSQQKAKLWAEKKHAEKKRTALKRSYAEMPEHDRKPIAGIFGDEPAARTLPPAPSTGKKTVKLASPKT